MELFQNKMNFFILLSCISFVQADWMDMFRHGYPPIASGRAAYTFYNFSTRYNHFNPMNTRKFNLSYTYNSDLYYGSGPLFLFIGGEGPIADLTGYLESGLMYEIAKQTGAYMFMLEHRYYGQSVPNGNLKTGNLLQLKVAQALKDISDFINDRKTNTSLKYAKVVVFGGSYAGNLAMWMREKYPDVVDAAVSSSAPLKAQVDFKEYLEVVQNSLNNTDCINTINEGISGIKVRLQTSEGVSQIESDFQLCGRLNANDRNEVINLFWNIASPFANGVQYGTIQSINYTCQQLLANSSAIDAYKRLAIVVTNKLGDSCIGNYRQMISSIKNTSPNNSGRAWWWQVCNEFGYFQTTTSKNQPFQDTMPLRFFQGICTKVFGRSPVTTYMGANNINQRYQGLKPMVKYVVSNQGSLDPWHALGLSKDLNTYAPVNYINGSSHCTDQLPPASTDPPGLTQARNRTIQSIISWLS